MHLQVLSVDVTQASWFLGNPRTPFTGQNSSLCCAVDAIVEDFSERRAPCSHCPHHLFGQEANHLQVTNVLFIKFVHDSFKDRVSVDMESKSLALHLLKPLVDIEEIQGVVSCLLVQDSDLLVVQFQGVCILRVLEFQFMNHKKRSFNLIDRKYLP